jgi:hypothetical protein
MMVESRVMSWTNTWADTVQRLSESACRFSVPLCGRDRTERAGIGTRWPCRAPRHGRDIAAFPLVRDPRFALDFLELSPAIRGVSLDCLLQHFRARGDAGEYSAVSFEIRKVQRPFTMHRVGHASSSRHNSNERIETKTATFISTGQASVARRRRCRPSLRMSM